MRFNDLLHLVATPAPRLDRGDSLGRRMGDLQHPVSSLQPRCRIPVRFPSSQTTFSPYIPLSADLRGREMHPFHQPPTAAPETTGDACIIRRSP